MSDNDPNPREKPDEHAPTGQPMEFFPTHEEYQKRLAQAAESVEKAANDVEGAEREEIRQRAEFIRDQLSWEMVECWPGLFRLYKTQSGAFRATLETSLSLVESDLRRGLGDSQSGVKKLLTALNMIHLCAVLPKHSGPPRRDEIPSPEVAQRTSVLELQQMAEDLYRRVLYPCIVFGTLQETLGQRLNSAFAASAEQHAKEVALLKSDLSKALDAFFSRSPDEVANNNKAMHKMPSGELRPFSLLAIEEARRWVEAHQQLPTKKHLHEI